MLHGCQYSPIDGIVKRVKQGCGDKSTPVHKEAETLKRLCGDYRKYRKVLTLTRLKDSITLGFVRIWLLLRLFASSLHLGVGLNLAMLDLVSLMHRCGISQHLGCMKLRPVEL